MSTTSTTLSSSSRGMNEVLSLLRTILASLSSSTLSSSSSSSSSSLSSPTTIILFALLVASELVTREGSGSISGGGGEDVRLLLIRLTSILDSSNDNNNIVLLQERSSSSSSSNSNIFVEWTISLFQLTRSVAGRRQRLVFADTALPIHHHQQQQQQSADQSAAALLIVTGDVACACRDSLFPRSSCVDDKNNDKVDVDSSLPLPQQLQIQQVVVEAVDNTKFNQAIDETIARCNKVEDYRLVGLLRLFVLANATIVQQEQSQQQQQQSQQQQQHQQSTTVVTTQTQQQQQQQQLVLQQCLTIIAYSNYLCCATTYGSGGILGKKQMIIWKKCLDMALLLSSSSSSYSSSSSGKNKSNTTLHIMSYRNIYTVIPIQNMIQLLVKANQKKYERIYELTLYLISGYLGIIDMRLLYMKNKVVLMGISSSGSGATTTMTEGGNDTDDGEEIITLITTNYLHNQCLGYVKLYTDMSVETVIQLAQEALLSLVVNPETATTTTTRTTKEGYEQILLSRYLQLQITVSHEEYTIWTEVCRLHTVMNNRRPENSLIGNSNSTVIKEGGGGIMMTDDSSSSSSSSSSNSIMTIVNKVRANVLLNKWNAVWEESSHVVAVVPPPPPKKNEFNDDTSNDDGGGSNSSSSSSNTTSINDDDYTTTLLHRILENISPNLIALRDAIIMIGQLNDAISDSCNTRSIMNNCHISLTCAIERLMDIVSLVPQATAMQYENDGGSSNVSITILWQAIVSFLTPLMKHYLHGLVVVVTGGDGGVESISSSSSSSVVIVNDISFRKLVECCSMTIITYAWLCDPSFVDVAPPTTRSSSSNDANNYNENQLLLSMAHSCLLKVRKEAEVMGVEKMKDKHLVSEGQKLKSMNDRSTTSVLSSKEKYSDYEKLELMSFRYALAASTCRTELINIVNDGSGSSSSSEYKLMDALLVLARKSTIAATSILKSSNNNFSNSHDLKSPLLLSSSSNNNNNPNAKFGTMYVHFLSVWMGMYYTPWPMCTIDQARTIIRNARDAITTAQKVWSRQQDIEQVLLNAGEADLEGCLIGGSTVLSDKLYRATLTILDEYMAIGTIDVHNTLVQKMLRVHCLLGLSRLSVVRNEPGDDDVVATEELARIALNILSSINSNHSSVLIGMSHAYHVCIARQLIADACIRSGRPEDAGSFLAEAVRDFPRDFDASFALAAFHLRTAIGKPTDLNLAKKATTLLLKTAKMDSTKSGPFALLGLCYEYQNDMPRAKGCYQKALTINPSHPVAGRGIVRLMSLEEVQSQCENAAKCNSHTNGWAWRALGHLKSRSVYGDITAAAICFQQALRCRDIHSPENDTLGVFFAEPTSSQVKYIALSEASDTWVELAACYRQLGKYSAALRAFEGALTNSGGNLSPDALCAWAQIDLDLGLYADASEKCSQVLSMKDISLHYYRRIAAYIEGQSCLFLARSCIQEGKFGSSSSYLERGIARLSSLSIHEKSSMNHYCEIKLLGDLYSLGNSLPSYAFQTNSPVGEHSEIAGNFSSNGIKNQLSFLMKGEHAYTLAMDMIKRVDEHECTDTGLIAAAAIDLATILLSQTRLFLLANGEDANKTGSQINNLIARSVNAYVLAIDVCPHDASAWCGLGCALMAVDPIMSQHAFSRALQIDPLFANSWSNISLMYASHDTQKCSEILDHLAEVDDTPLMWIGRGFLFENNALGDDWTDQDGGASRAGCYTKAADAYRAALQIMQHPAALLGLSLTCRRATNETTDLVYTGLAEKATKFESMTSLVIHQNLIGEDNNGGASIVSGLTQIEKELNLLTNSDNLNNRVLITEAKKAVKDFMTRSATVQNEVFKLAECEMDLSVNLALYTEKKEEFPSDMIKTALDCDVSVSSNDNFKGNSDSGINKAQFSVLLNPDSGEAWLIFAHQLAKEITDRSIINSSLTSAKIAAKRSYDLLHERVVNATMLTPRRQDLHQEGGRLSNNEYSDMSALSNLPPATILSKSMSLLAWLDGIELHEMGNKRSYASLQEALMLDPSNSFAVAALGL